MNPNSPSGGRARCTRDAPRRPGARGTSAAQVLRWAARWLPGMEDELAGLRAVVAPGAVCVNIAAVGATYTVVLSHLVGPEGRVHHFELSERPARPVDVAALLACENVTVHRIATGESGHQRALHSLGHRMTPVQGRCRLPAGPSEPRAAREPQQAGTPSPGPAPVQTLGGVSRWLPLERVDFIMVDAGSAGRRVLAGVFYTLLRDRPVLLVRTEAWHRPGHDFGSLVRSLTVTLGYHMFRWGAGSWHRTVGLTDDCRMYLFRAQPSGFRQE
ncbi:hypothetical protein GCM10010103_00080 [Streptomyces paradoxus]|uniref:Methyltransferase n=1 Tax=Streptomyces paradoxus TaxID=66375 RepID=A0A7W9T877_9ACTN|nr:hypothetical protein [Streptomyces paradoxus]MBB6075117.1 hypothetical protein [Streptomyces paradoxus]